MKHLNLFTLILFSELLFFSFGQSGTLDPTFGTNGIVTTPFTGDNSGQDVAIQTDGKIVVVGSTNDSIQNLRVIRYLFDGTLDNSFGLGGTVTIDAFFSMGNAILIQPDGKIVVAGNAFSIAANAHILVARFNTDGSFDNTFGTAGIVTTPVGNYGSIGNDLALQPDGKIVVGGSSFSTPVLDMLLLRFNPDGSLDSTFGTSGKRLIGVTSMHEQGEFVLLQDDGKILIGGLRQASNDPADMMIARILPNGTNDVSFGTNGVVVTDVQGQSDWGNAGAIQNDGKIIMAGLAEALIPVGAYTPHFCVVRYNVNGSLDTTFNSTGIVTDLVVGIRNIGNAVQVQLNGCIVVAGRGEVNGLEQFIMARYNPNGSLDNTFGSNGYVITNLGTGADVCNGMAIQSDTLILLCGNAENSSGDNDFALARYSNGTVGISELQIESNDLSVYPNPIRNNSILSYSLNQNDCVSIDLYDSKGSHIQSVLKNENQSKGEKSVNLQLISDLPQGVYSIRVKSSSSIRSIHIYK